MPSFYRRRTPGMIYYTVMKRFLSESLRCGLITGIAAMFMSCQDGAVGGPFAYFPDITFAGYINGDYDSLTGNRAWPNTCRLIGDTVRMYCYSTGFSETDRVRRGDLLRLDLLPDSADGFQKRNVLFHLARYYDASESYTVNKGDSIDVSIRFESEIRSFSRVEGAAIELDKIYVATPAVKQGSHLTITDGHLLGSICRP
jgi:hypothetical protein